MKRLFQKIRGRLKNRRIRQLWSRTVSIVAALVVFVTTYALVLPAITMEKEAECGIEAHQHDDTCYEMQLSCMLDESADHQHTESCYAKVLVCAKEVHTHTPECYADAGEMAEPEETGGIEVTSENAYGMGTGTPDESIEDESIEDSEEIRFEEKSFEEKSFDEDDLQEDSIREDSFEEDDYNDENSMTEAAEIDTEEERNGFTDSADDTEFTGTEESDPLEEEIDFADDTETEEPENQEDGSGSGEPLDMDFQESADAAEETEEETFLTEETGTEENGLTDTSEDLENQEAEDADADLPEDISGGTESHTGADEGTAGGNLAAEEAGETVNSVEEGLAEEGQAETEESGEELTDTAGAAEGSPEDTAGTGSESDPYVPSLEQLDFAAALDSRTAVYYYPVAEGETIEDSSGLTGWQKVDQDTELGPNDLIRIYLSYTIPAGSLNETNPTAVYRLPACLHLADAQVNGINEIRNGIAASFMDYDTLSITDLESFRKYLGAEAVEGTRTPDQDVSEYLETIAADGKDAGEFISAVVRVEDVNDTKEMEGGESGASGQNLIFTFTPYTVEKNRHTYDASGLQTGIGEEVHGWFALDFNMQQVDWEQAVYIPAEWEERPAEETTIDSASGEEQAAETAVDPAAEEDQVAETAADPASGEEQAAETAIDTGSVEDQAAETIIDTVSEEETSVVSFGMIEKTTEILFRSDGSTEDGREYQEIRTALKMTEPASEQDWQNWLELQNPEQAAAEEQNTEIQEPEEQEEGQDSASAETEDSATQDENPDEAENPGQENTSADVPGDGEQTFFTMEDPDEQEKSKNQDEEKDSDVNSEEKGREKDSSDPDKKTDPADYPAHVFEEKITVRTQRLASDAEKTETSSDVIPSKTELTVHVEAEKGTFPEGTIMKLRAVAGEDADAVAGMLGEALDAQTQTRGFQAVDITFYNAQGKEIEPLKPVSVSMHSESIRQALEDTHLSPVIMHLQDPAREQRAAELQEAGNAEVQPADQAVGENAAEQKTAGTDTEEETSELQTEDAAEKATDGPQAEDAREEDAEALQEKDAAEEGTDETQLEETAGEDVPEQQKEGILEKETEEQQNGDETAEVASGLPAGEVVVKTIEQTNEGEKAPDAITFEAGSFSIYAIVYTVDFHWEVDGKKYEFSIPGGGFVSFTDLVEVLGIANNDTTSGSEGENAAENNEIEAGNGENTDVNAVNNVVEETDVEDTGTYSDAISLNNVEVSDATKQFVADVESVESSSPELVWVGKIDEESTVGELKEANELEVQYTAELTEEEITEINNSTVESGDWALISMLPFTSKESLTVTMKNGDQFVVKVTDAADPNPEDPLGLDGQSLAIINNRDGGSNWQALKDEADNNIDSRGYYMSGNATTYSNVNGVDYASSSDTAWTFEYVSTDNSGSYYHISTSNGYLYIDPNVQNKTQDMNGNGHQYIRALRVVTSAGDGSSADGTLIRVVSNGDGTYLLQNRNSVDLWNYGNNQFWLSTTKQVDNEGATSILNSRFRLARLPEPPHVTVHYVDRNGNVLTGVQYTGGNTAVVNNGDGTFTIPYSLSGNVDLRSQFDFSSIGADQQEYTYANTHLAGQNASGEQLTYEGYVIDSLLTGTGTDITIYSDSGETSDRYERYNQWGWGEGDILSPIGNLGYRPLDDFSLSGQLYRRPAVESGSSDLIVYVESGSKDIYVILDPLPTSNSSGAGSVDPGDIENPSLEKTMEDNEDGTYTLSLKVDAHASNAADTNKANVLLVVDTSSSMRAYTSSNNSSSRITDTHDAVKSLGDQLLAYNTSHADAVEVAMITFDGSVVERLDWTTNQNTFDTVVDEYLKYYYLHTGTDWEDSLKEALHKLQNDTDDDPTFVVFFTDGEPSQYTNFHGMGENTNTNAPDPITHNTNHESVTNGYPDFFSYFLCRESSKDEMRAIVNEGAILYGIYAYNSTNSSYSSYNGAEDGAKMLHNAIKYGYDTSSDLTGKLFFEAHDTSDLQGAFDAIFNSITESVGFTNVVVKDGIAAGVTSSTVVDGDVSGFTYIIRDKSGALAYQVKVAPNGVPEGTTPEPAVGTPVFTLSDGSVHIGEIRAVTTTKIKLDNNGNPVTDSNGNILTETVSVNAYYYKDPDDPDAAEYIMPISTTGENIRWDLSPLGILKDGYSYEVNFVVWPNQEAYDLVADLNNGKRTDLEADADWEHQPVLTDSAGRKYRKGGFADYPYISRYEDNGVYAAMSNTDQSIEYYKIDQKIENGEEVTKITGPFPETVAPPDPMPLTASLSQVEKQWIVERDPGILAQYLYNTDGTSKEFSVAFDIYQGTVTSTSTPYTTVSLGWDPTANDGEGAYVWAPESPTTTVTYAGHTHEIGTRWAEEFSIATGLMLSEGEMEELGLNKSHYPSCKYPADSETGTVYYILEEGHDYTIREHQTGTIGYEFDFEAPVYHPMLVDGVLQSVNMSITENGENELPTVSITNMTSAEAGLDSLVLKNTLRGYIHLNKIVVKGEENHQVASDNTKFEYTVVLNNTTDPGPFVGDHIPWYGINDLYYHDSNFNYYQIYETQNRTWELKNEKGDIYVVTSSGFNPDNVGAQTVTYRISADETATVVVYGNQMTASNDGKTATSTLKITQAETLNLANIPVGTTYTITESAATGYDLIGILKEIKDGETVESSEAVEDISGRSVTGTIVSNRDNHIVYTNKQKTGALKLTKIVQVDNHAPSGSDEMELVDGDYYFILNSAENSTAVITKYIQITVSGGTAVSYKVADTAEDLTSARSEDDSWALITELLEGDYTIVETNERNGLQLTAITRGDNNAEAVDLENSKITVHVTADDNNADVTSAQASFTNNYYHNDGPDKITLDIVKTFSGITSENDIPDEFEVMIGYTLGSDEKTITLKKNQNETNSDGIKIVETADGLTLSWHITQIPSEAKNFKIKEVNYGSVTGYDYTATTLDGTDITGTAGNWHDMDVTAPVATFGKVTGERLTPDNDKNYKLYETDVILISLTGAQGTLVISPTSLNYTERKAIEFAIDHKNDHNYSTEFADIKNGSWKTPCYYFSIEEHSEEFLFKGYTITPVWNETYGCYVVHVHHSQSSMEEVFAISYGNQNALNNAALTNAYIQKHVEMDVVKVQKDNDNIKLSGAQFTLRMLAEDADKKYPVPTAGGTFDGTEMTGSPITTGSNGKGSFTGLTQGYYELSETKSPDGYILTAAEPIYFRVNDGIIYWIEWSEAEAKWVQKSEGTMVSFEAARAATPNDPDTPEDESQDAVIATFTVENEPGAALPNTGGPGTQLFTILGSILIAGAGVLLVRRRRRTI